MKYKTKTHVEEDKLYCISACRAWKSQGEQMYADLTSTAKEGQVHYPETLNSKLQQRKNVNKTHT